MLWEGIDDRLARPCQVALSAMTMLETMKGLVNTDIWLPAIHRELGNGMSDYDEPTYLLHSLHRIGLPSISKVTILSATTSSGLEDAVVCSINMPQKGCSNIRSLNQAVVLSANSNM